MPCFPVVMGIRPSSGPGSAGCASRGSMKPRSVMASLQVVPFYQDADPTGPGARYRALVLDSSYRPIDVVSWQRAICLDLFDKVGPGMS